MRAWLGWIARRLVQEQLRGRGNLKEFNLELGQWQQVVERTAVEMDKVKAERVRGALLRLSKREQLVLRVTMQWYQADKDHQRLPNEVAADLVKTLQTTPENLRQIRRRALRKLAVELVEIM